MDAEQAVAEWPDFLVELLQEDIKIAHEINQKGWGIHSYTGRTGVRPVLGVGHNTVLAHNLDKLVTIALDRDALSQPLIDHLEAEYPPRDLRQNWILTSALPASFVEDRFSELESAHHSLVRRLASSNYTRWKWHRVDFQDAFTSRLEDPLPMPGYLAAMKEWRKQEERRGKPEPKYDSRTVEPTGYWKITSNTNNKNEYKDYERAIKQGIVVHRYGSNIYDYSTLPEDRGEFVKAASQLPEIKERASNRIWLFTHGVQIGDWIVLQSDYPAIGQITGDYAHTDDGDLRSVNWQWVSSNQIQSKIFYDAINGRNLWGFTTLEPIEFKRILEALGQEGLVDLSHVSESAEQPQLGANVSLLQISPQDISDHFAASGLHYSNTQIADFYTALQTKGFVVLSGISGTGKSKIATGFTELLPHALHTEIAGPDPVTAYQALRFKVSSSETWAAISSDQSHLFPKTAATTRQQVNFIFEGASYRGTYRTRTLNYGKPTLYLILGRALAERLRASAGDNFIYAQFRAAPNDGTLPEVHISLVEPKLTQSTQAVETFTVPNTLFLSVRPDWRDSTSLLGYYNPLTKTYEWTDFLRFVLDAAENYRSDNPIAWFVILDEMNLAHVEYYFADLLSVLESGRETNPDHEDFGFTVQPLRLTYPEIVANEAPPTEVRLPPNLYIIGTVNMDETTHAFSPKVLDRAFTMELTDVDFSDYPRATPEDDGETFDDAEKQQFLQVFSQNGAFPQIRKEEIREFVSANEDIRRSIQTLNTNLANYRFHFGYRVFDEIMQFLTNAEANEMYDDDGHVTALDSAAFMKILPKFSGSEARVGLPLAALIEWAKDPFAQGEDATPLERTLKRAEYMQSVLQTDGFVTAF